MTVQNGENILIRDARYDPLFYMLNLLHFKTMLGAPSSANIQKEIFDLGNTEWNQITSIKLFVVNNYYSH